MKEHEASLLAITVCEKLATEFQSVGKPNAQCVPKINDRERQCIEYVLRKLYYSIKTDSPQNCTMKAIIISLKEDNIVNQLLISAVNRGGLWGIKRPACNLLLAAERKFREATVGPNVISIPSDTMAMRLLDDIHIRELYSNIFEKCSVYKSENEEICGLLKTSCKRFFHHLRVRSFSYAKDIINKQKFKKTPVKKKS